MADNQRAETIRRIQIAAIGLISVIGIGGLARMADSVASEEVPVEEPVVVRHHEVRVAPDRERFVVDLDRLAAELDGWSGGFVLRDHRCLQPDRWVAVQVGS